jgi:hypothetical protein
MAMHEEDVERVCRQGAEAWKRLKKDKNWNDWLKVGEAHTIGRDWAQRIAGTNRPWGKAYNAAFGEWLQKYKFDDMDKGDRSRLFAVMDNLGQIEEWRMTLTLTERLKLNHPNAVLRKWKAHMAPEERTETGEPKPTLRDSIVNLSEEVTAKDREIADLKTHIAELEAAREVAPPGASITTTIVGALSTLIGGKITLDDVLPGKFDPSAILTLAGDLTDIHEKMTRPTKSRARPSPTATELPAGMQNSPEPILRSE